jgi:hypothetical protein
MQPPPPPAPPSRDQRRPPRRHHLTNSIRPHFQSRNNSGWRPEYNAAAGGTGILFETKLQTINRLQEGLHFLDGKRYDRAGYQEMADAFFETYKRTHPALVTKIETARSGAAASAESADDVPVLARDSETTVWQEEFWRVVETNVEQVRVEYGSDLDAAIYGTGFVEKQNHAWDFNELIHHPSNLLRVVGDDVPGLTRPWLYFGMLFSAFCWHVEDHYLGSVNYMHFGSPKTWYGVPGSNADLFERAVRTMVPSLLDDKPDLLHRLVTLVPPGSLRDAHGVDVCQTTQHAGEFVVTWPRAYHAGFSMGFNVAEAVNFGTSEWVKAGRTAVEGYARGVGKRDAVFSHDRMVVDTGRDFAKRLKTAGPGAMAPWIKAVSVVLKDELLIIAKEQTEGRAMMRGRGARIATALEIAENEIGNDVCCSLCKSMPHLAVVRCAKCWSENEKLEVQVRISQSPHSSD